MNKLIKYSIITSALMMFASGAGAVVVPTPAYCSDSDPNADGMSVSDVTYNGNDSDDCYGVLMGNENGSPSNDTNNNQIHDTLETLWGGSTDSWSFLVKDDGIDNSFMGIDFDVTADTGTGNWTLTGIDTNDPTILPTNLDFIVVLNASDRFGAWFLDDVAFDGSDAGTWSIQFVNNGNQIPDLSHLSLYVREGEEGERPPRELPEPASLGLIAFGLLGLAFIRRRS